MWFWIYKFILRTIHQCLPKRSKPRNSGGTTKCWQFWYIVSDKVVIFRIETWRLWFLSTQESFIQMNSFFSYKDDIFKNLLIDNLFFYYRYTQLILKHFILFTRKNRTIHFITLFWCKMFCFLYRGETSMASDYEVMVHGYSDQILK